MRFNFVKTVTNLDGTPTVDQEGEAYQVHKVLANNLVNSTKGNSIKFYDWALQLWKVGTLELDRADQTILKSFVESIDTMAVLVKAQIIGIIDHKPDNQERPESI
jgi:hypothetical protein